MRSLEIIKYVLLSGLFIVFSCRKSLDSPPELQSYSSNLSIINDVFNGKEVVVVGSRGLQLLVAYERRTEDGVTLEMERPTSLALPAMCKDQFDNTWDLYGECLEGPRKGEYLKMLNASSGFYFAFNAIYNGVAIYSSEGEGVNIALNESGEWLIEEDFVFTIGSFDAIPSVEDASFEVYRSKDYLSSEFFVDQNETVLVIKIGEEIRAYPYSILTRHEIINDQIDDIRFSVNYCPLTATGYCWERNDDSFGVSGMLYNNNLILYDRASESLWSQVIGVAVQGDRKGENVPKLRILETKFETFVNMYDSQGKVMVPDPAYNFNYSDNPYLQYNLMDQYLLYPLAYHDDRLLNKERVLAIVVNGKCKVYPYSLFN